MRPFPVFPSCTLPFAARAGLVLVALMAGPVAHAGEIYRWVDEAGRTHLSDVVPEKYRKSAQRIDTSRSEVSPERRQEAERAAAREKAAADDTARRVQPPASPPPGAASMASAKRPAQGVNDSTDCPTWRRLYEESQACFAPYRTVNGATKAEAFDKCTTVASPDDKCGPVKTSPNQ